MLYSFARLTIYDHLLPPWTISDHLFANNIQPFWDYLQGDFFSGTLWEPI